MTSHTFSICIRRVGAGYHVTTTVTNERELKCSAAVEHEMPVVRLDYLFDVAQHHCDVQHHAARLTRMIDTILISGTILVAARRMIDVSTEMLAEGKQISTVRADEVSPRSASIARLALKEAGYPAFVSQNNASSQNG